MGLTHRLLATSTPWFTLAGGSQAADYSLEQVFGSPEGGPPGLRADLVLESAKNGRWE